MELISVNGLLRVYSRILFRDTVWCISEFSKFGKLIYLNIQKLNYIKERVLILFKNMELFHNILYNQLHFNYLQLLLFFYKKDFTFGIFIFVF
jgi:hypothetical protein